MADDITNGVLLEHMQGMKNDLQQQIVGLKNDLQKQISRLDEKLTRLAQRVEQGFEDARLHRQALQEDLEETMRVQGRHGAKLARL